MGNCHLSSLKNPTEKWIVAFDLCESKSAKEIFQQALTHLKKIDPGFTEETHPHMTISTTTTNQISTMIKELSKVTKKMDHIYIRPQRFICLGERTIVCQFHFQSELDRVTFMKLIDIVEKNSNVKFDDNELAKMPPKHPLCLHMTIGSIKTEKVKEALDSLRAIKLSSKESIGMSEIKIQKFGERDSHNFQILFEGN